MFKNEFVLKIKPFPSYLSQKNVFPRLKYPRFRHLKGYCAGCIFILINAYCMNKLKLL